MLKLAIVGLGRWGQRLVDSVQAPQAQGSALLRFTHGVVRTPGKAAEFALARGLILETDYSKVLGNPSIDGIVLATPHSQHEAQVAAAAEAGKHVFVEKPLTVGIAGALRAVAACQAAGVVLALGHNRRFLPAMDRVRTMISHGELGQILHLEGNFSGNFGLSFTDDNWRSAESESPAGAMTAMGIHIVDAFLDLAGPISTVAAQSVRRVLPINLDDTTSLLVRFDGGVSGYIGTIFATGRIFRIQVFGTGGWAHMLDHNILEVSDINGRVERVEFDHHDIERAELEAFADAIAGRSEYPVPVQDGVRGIAVLEAAVRSAKNRGRFEAVAI